MHTEQNATIRVPLKQRGDVRCKIASDAEEHLLEFTAETQETVQALQELRGTLEERLAALGLHQVKIKVSLGSVKHLSTDWLDSLRALQVTVD